MDAKRFDTVTRSLTFAPSRRGILGLTLAGALHLLFGLANAEAKKKKPKKLKKNKFGCVNVGNKCRGNSANCCSGICQGKKPKKGKKDKSKCVAHDTGTCQVSQDSCVVGTTTCTTDDGQDGFCHGTTGNAGYCALFGNCFPCTKDADCQAFCGPVAACGVCEPDCAETGGTECFSLEECVFP
jgi:hypothetical protein